MLRTFLALDLDDAFHRTTTALLDELRHGDGAFRIPRARWVAPSTLHVTVRFLGATDETLVPSLEALIVKLVEGSPTPIDVRTTSLLAFPQPRRARVLGLALDDGGMTAAIAAAAEKSIVTLGFSPEEREFRPHLTLARFREPADLRGLFEVHSEPRAGGRLRALTLYKSELGKDAPLHTPLARREFGREARRSV